MPSYEASSRKPGLTATAAPLELIARRAVQAACFGFFVDMFEVYLPIAMLAPALVYFVPGGLDGGRAIYGQTGIQGSDGLALLTWNNPRIFRGVATKI
jgi:hypothetical protein